MSNTVLVQQQHERSNREEKRIRILVAKPGLDGHDRGALVLCRAFRDAGMEVIYSGLLPTPEQVAQMAIDEDVDVVALSLLNGAHMTAFPKVIEFLRKKGGSDIAVVGGGIIPDEDKPKLERMGIIGNFGPGTSLNEIIEYIRNVVRRKRSGTLSKSKKKSNSSDKRKSKLATRKKEKSSPRKKDR